MLAPGIPIVGKPMWPGREPEARQRPGARPEVPEFTHGSARFDLGPVRPGPVRPGPVRPGPMRTGPMRTGPVQLAPVRLGPVRLGPVQLDPVQLGRPSSVLAVDHRTRV